MVAPPESAMIRISSGPVLVSRFPNRTEPSHFASTSPDSPSPTTGWYLLSTFQSLSVPLQQPSVRTQIEEGVVERATVDLGHPEDDVRGHFRRRLCDSRYGRAGHADGIGGKALHELGVIPCGGAPDPVGIGGDERLGENDQFCSVTGSFLYYMAINPGIQDKAQKELDGIIGNRLSDFSDRPNMPIVYRSDLSRGASI